METDNPITNMLEFDVFFFLSKFSVIQFLAVKPAAQIHHPSVCRHVSGLQFGEHTWEQFVPKYPFKQELLQCVPTKPSRQPFVHSPLTWSQRSLIKQC